MLWTPSKRALFDGRYSPVNTRAKEILHRLGQLPNLALLLDAGDSASIGAGATKWLDLSGNGYDFFLGTTAGAEGSDPTFNGAVGGLSFGEYLSLDGGDFLTYDATNETWMQNMHKASALFSMYAWVYGSGAGTGNSIFGTNGNNPANIGVFLRGDSSALGSVQYQVQNGTGTASLNLTSSNGPYKTGQWNFVGLSVDEAAGVGDMVVNNWRATFTATYTTPSAANASFTMQIGSRANNNSPFDAGGRLGQIAFWDARFIARNEMEAIRNATAGRYAGLNSL
jgi:hypothetical protein